MVDTQLLIILLLTAVIHFIGTCAYAFRIAAVRTGQIAVAFSLFNVLMVMSRTSNSFQAPFIAKRVETALSAPTHADILFDLRLILWSATLATLAAGLLIPTLQRLATQSVKSFTKHKSLLRLLKASLSFETVRKVGLSLAPPRPTSLSRLNPGKDVPFSMITLNVGANALWTVAVIASIYAGYLVPELRLTANSLSAVINGFATIFLFLVLDPYIAIATDDAAKRRLDATSVEASYRRIIVWMVITRLLGTVLAQVILIPGAYIIIVVAKLL